MDSKGLGRTLAVVYVALGALAVADRVVPYGWKVFVLTKIFKISWAIALALVLVALVHRLLPNILGLGDSAPLEVFPAAQKALTVIGALLVAFVTLGYMLPDWNPWTEGMGAIAATGWGLLLLALAGSSRIPPSRR